MRGGRSPATSARRPQQRRAPTTYAPRCAALSRPRSHLHLPCISPTSPLHLPCISPASPLHLLCISQAYCDLRAYSAPLPRDARHFDDPRLVRARP